MVLLIGGNGGGMRLFHSKRILVGGSLLLMILFYYVALPEPQLPRAEQVVFVDDDLTQASSAPVVHHPVWKSNKGSKVLLDNADAIVALPAPQNNSSRKKTKWLENSEESKVEMATKPELDQEQDDEQGDEKEDGASQEAVERKQREQEGKRLGGTQGLSKQGGERVHKPIDVSEGLLEEYEREQGRDYATQVEVNRRPNEGGDDGEYQGDNIDDFGEDDRYVDGKLRDDLTEEDEEELAEENMHQLVEDLYQGDNENMADNDGYLKEDRLGQAGPLETMDDED
ncbi:hypothetical protein EDD11_003071 [Mortierella claussenii]|nr:hypothetical protein EDD11_003071 [Mortierella claussenii]